MSHLFEGYWMESPGTLVRGVVPQQGRPYVHKCDRATFEEVCYRIDEGTHSSALRRDKQLRDTRCAVALGFLRDRCLITRGRNRIRRSLLGSVHTEGMCCLDALWQSENRASGEHLKTLFYSYTRRAG